MKLAFVMILAVCLVAIFAVGAMAGDYHVGSKLKCYQCHVMHQTKSHLYADDTRDDWGGTGAVSSFDHLLKYEDINEMCLECHNEGDRKDVYGVAETVPTLQRIGGWFNNDAAGAYVAPVASVYSHNLANGAEVPPGGSVAVDLDCTSCHEPHGNAYYRNLNEVGGEGISYASTTNDPTKDVFQKLATGLKYDVSDVSYNLPSSGSHHYEQFCASCHTSIHNDDSSGGWLKHPTIGHSVSFTAGTVSPLKTLGGLPEAGGSGSLVAGDVSCVTCHKAHGSSHPFGLVYDNRTTTALEDATSSENIRVTCKHCHDKGLTTTE
ncbi:MAG: cytochrome c3 family protein [Armatimonadota bacterium]|nr:cytochrome c3 family protein [Armatimonadota bacterium]